MMTRRNKLNKSNDSTKKRPKLSSSSDNSDAELSNEKNISVKKAKVAEIVSDDESSDSSVEKYLKSPEDLDFNSTFFQTNKKSQSFNDIESKIFSGIEVQTLSDSDSELEDDLPETTEKEKKQIMKFAEVNSFNDKMEQMKRCAENYKKTESKEDNIAISELLSIGEFKLEGHSMTMDSEDEEMDWEEIEDKAEMEIPKEGVQITVELPTKAKKKQSNDDIMTLIKRRINRNKRETQVYMHKVHLLCWIAHGNYLNSILNNEDLLQKALKLLPSEECFPPKHCNIKYLEQILTWYKKMMKFDPERKQSDNIKNALFAQISDKVCGNQRDFVLLFLVILRSLGLQCRLVLSLQCVPLKLPNSQLFQTTSKSEPASESKATSNKSIKNTSSKSSKSESKATSNTSVKNTSSKSSKSEFKATSNTSVKNTSSKSSKSESKATSNTSVKNTSSKSSKSESKTTSNTSVKNTSSKSSKSKNKSSKTKESSNETQKTEIPFKKAVEECQKSFKISLDSKSNTTVFPYQNNIDKDNKSKTNQTSIPTVEIAQPSTSTRTRHSSTSAEIVQEPSSLINKKTTSSVKTNKKMTPVKVDEKPSSSSGNKISSRDKKTASVETDRKDKRCLNLEDFKKHLQEEKNESKPSASKITTESSRSKSELKQKNSKNDLEKEKEESKSVKATRSRRETSKRNESKNDPNVDESKSKIEKVNTSKSSSSAESTRPRKQLSKNQAESSSKSKSETKKSSKSKQSEKNSSTKEKNSRSVKEIKIPQLDGANDDSSSTSKQKRKRKLKEQIEKNNESESDDFCISKKHPRKSAKNVKYFESESTADSNEHPKSKSIKSKKIDVRDDIKNIIKDGMMLNSEDSDSDFEYLKPFTATKKKSKKKTTFKEKWSKNIAVNYKVKKRVKPKSQLIDNRAISTDEEPEEIASKVGNDVWIEIFLEEEEKWISCDVFMKQIHCVKELHTRATQPVSYILAWNNNSSIKDITSRYCVNWNTVTRKLRVDPEWWEKTLAPFVGKKTARDREEDEDLASQLLDKPLPTTINEYKNHPLYALRRHLLKFEAIYPSDAMTLGFIRKEPVYSRECVHTLHSREIWVKHAKVVKPEEKPYKIVKARSKYDRMTGKMITDLPLELFGSWQVEDYKPPTAENGIVPRNPYGNVDLFKMCMLPKKTVHLQLPGLNKIARKLQIDCAPAVIGFDFHGGSSHPVYDGFVVCEEFKDTLIAAWEEDREETIKREQEKFEKRVYGNWRKLIKGLLIREKLKLKYDFGGDEIKKKKIKK